MKNKIPFILLIALFLSPLFNSCGPVRSGSYQKSKETAASAPAKKTKTETAPTNAKKQVSDKKATTKSKSKEDNSDNALIERKNKNGSISDNTSAKTDKNAVKGADQKNKKRFSDTVVTRVVIDMQKNINPKEKELLNLFQILEKPENQEAYDKACATLIKYDNFSDVSDSIKSNALFHKGECLLNKVEIDGSLKCFEAVLSENTDETIIEKTLVRLGHLFCYKKDFEKAEMYFTELKNKFPESIYLQIANCEKGLNQSDDKSSE